MPVLHALATAGPGDTRLVELLGSDLSRDPVLLDEALGLLRKHPGLDLARADVRHWANKAASTSPPCPMSRPELLCRAMRLHGRPHQLGNNPNPSNAFLCVTLCGRLNRPGGEEIAVGLFGTNKTRMVAPEQALRRRQSSCAFPRRTKCLAPALLPPYPDGSEIADFALGCFWGAERKFWLVPGVITTAVGYEGGFTPNPTYEEVCSGNTGHTEAVRVVFDPRAVSYRDLLKVFWESARSDPRHGSGQRPRHPVPVGDLYHSPEQKADAEDTASAFQEQLTRARLRQITTEIAQAPEFYFAEPYHQQYLSDNKNPYGYCGLGGTGVSCPVGVAGAERLTD